MLRDGAAAATHRSAGTVKEKTRLSGVDPVDATDSDSRHPPCAVWCQRVLEWVVRAGCTVERSRG